MAFVRVAGAVVLCVLCRLMLSHRVAHALHHGSVGESAVDRARRQLALLHGSHNKRENAEPERKSNVSESA